MTGLAAPVPLVPRNPSPVDGPYGDTGQAGDSAGAARLPGPPGQPHPVHRLCMMASGGIAARTLSKNGRRRSR